MRVLYAIANYPQLSETYITAEIAFMLRAGVEVRVWSPIERLPDIPPQTIVYRSLLADAVKSFKPDVVHVHYLMFARRYDKLLEGIDVPMTVRGHSFDFTPALVGEATSIARVKKVYLFPHFARLTPHEKVVALPVAFDSSRFKPQPQKDPMMVLRLGAGRPGKGYDDFFAASKACLGFKFIVALATCDDDPRFLERLTAKHPNSRVSSFRDISWYAAEQLTAKAAIYLDTSEPAVQPFGMPISIAEALACGAIVLIRDSMAAREYAGDAAFYYQTPAEAADIISTTVAWNSDAKKRLFDRAVMQGAFYADSAVLPRLLHDWESIAAQRR
jgi:glycosyltransferase involved in cell wall biosynthesis